MSFADRTVRAFLEEVAAHRAAPGAGAVAATVTGAAAALVAMGARFAGGAFAEAASEADALRARALALADEDAEAYAGVLDAARRTAGDPGRGAAVASALERASDVPLEILDVACGVAALGVRVLEASKPDLRGDVATGILLAEAAGRSAGELVAINVGDGALDAGRATRAADLAGTLERTAGAVPLGLRHE